MSASAYRRYGATAGAGVRSRNNAPRHSERRDQRDRCLRRTFRRGGRGLGPSTTPSRKWPRVTVRDNGKGIAVEDRTRIFQVFESTKGNKGTGLGLSVSQKILHEHGGEIRVESTPEQGARSRWNSQRPPSPPRRSDPAPPSESSPADYRHRLAERLSVAKLCVAELCVAELCVAELARVWQNTLFAAELPVAEIAKTKPSMRASCKPIQTSTPRSIDRTNDSTHH